MKKITEYALDPNDTLECIIWAMVKVMDDGGWVIVMSHH